MSALLFLFLLTTFAADTPENQGHPVPTIEVAPELIFQGNGVLWGFDFLDEDHVLLSFKEGIVALLDLKTKKAKAIEGGPGPLVAGQGGLMDLKVHRMGKETWIYFTCSVTDTQDLEKNTTALFRAQWNGTRLVGLKKIFEVAPTKKSQLHFGSRLAFAKGYVYMTMGERNERANAQDLKVALGKVLRLTETGEIPKDNPFVGRADARPEIYTYGHRNPQGIAIDPVTGDVYECEHGPRGGDEINLLKAGRNYGWPVVTYGREYYGPAIGESFTKPGMEDSVHHYVPSIAPSSLLITTKRAKPEALRSRFLLGALALQHLNIVQLKPKLTEVRALSDFHQRIRNVGESPHGVIYISTDSGQFVRLN